MVQSFLLAFACANLRVFPDAWSRIEVTITAERLAFPAALFLASAVLAILVFYAILVILHTRILRDFCHFAHLYVSRCASASEKLKKNAKNRVRSRKNREIANGTRLLAHRSRSLRSRSLAHRVKHRCAGTNIA